MAKAIIAVITVLAVCFFSTTCNPPLFPKKLWVYWHSPIEEAPFLVQLCVQKMRMACQQSNWTLYVLNQTNLPELLPNFYEKYKPVADNAKHPGWQASVADLIRLAVLQENGGVYLDISTILFRGLGWLQRLQEFPYLLTNSQIDQGIYPQVLQSYIGYYQSSSQIRDPQKGITNWFPGYESWFFASKPKAAYITALRQRHAHHYVHTQQQNRIEDIEKNYFLRFTQSDYLNNQKSAYQILQETQFQLDKNLTLFGKRINVNNHFKLVGFHAEYGPLAFYLKLVPQQKLFTHTVSQIEEQDHIQLQFLLKFTNNDRPFITEKIDRMVQLAKTYPNIRQNFDKFMDSKPSADQCRDLKFIVEGSVFGDLIQNNKIALEKNVTTITIEQREKWLAYCHRTHNTPTSVKTQIDGRIKMIIDEQILSNTAQYLSLQNNLKLREFLVEIGQLYMSATSQIMGGFSDAHEVYYWKKRYEQKMADKIMVVNDEQNPSTGNSLEKYSFWQLLKLRLKLKILSNRTHLAFAFKIGNYFLLFTFVLAYVFLIITIKIKFLFFLGKWLYVISCVMMVYAKGQNRYSISEVVEETKQKLQKMVGQVKGVKADQVIKFTSHVVVFLIKQSAVLLLAVIFVVYNAFVCYKYYAVVYFGQIYYQESTLLMYILLQVAFRKIFIKIGQEKWSFPGLTFGQLRIIFLPIYIFCIGASIIVMGERVELRNLVLSSSLCMILPVLIKQAKLQICKIIQPYNIKKILNKFSNIYAKTSVSILFQAMNNLSTIAQMAIITFLVLNILLPNLRFLVSNNEIYTMTKFLYSMKKLTYFMFWLIVGFYLIQIFQRSKLIRKNAITFRGKKTQNDNLAKQVEDSQFSLNISSIQQVEPLDSDSAKKSNFKLSTKKPPSIFYQILQMLLLVAFYSLKILIFYQMIYLPWQELAIKNTWSLFYQQQVIWLEHQRPFCVILNMMALFALFFVSFELEKMLEKTFIHKYTNYRMSALNKNQSAQQSQIDISENPVAKCKKQQSTNIQFLFLIGLILFMIPRFKIITKIFTELTAIDTKDQSLKFQTEKELWDLVYESLIYIVYGFKIIKKLLLGWAELVKEDLQKNVVVWKEKDDLKQFDETGSDSQMQKPVQLIRAQ